MILTSLQKLPNNVGDLGKIIIATGFEWLPKVQKIAQSGHTAHRSTWLSLLFQYLRLFPKTTLGYFEKYVYAIDPK